jgi:D-alanine-D-alanine ligase
MTGLKIAVLSNFFSEYQNKEVEVDLMETANAVKKALESFGHEAEIFDVNEKTFDILRKRKIDFAFNVCERFKGASFFEPHVAAMLELIGIPYTGSGPLALALCMNKIKVKEILSHNGIPTPRFQVFYSRNQKLNPELEFPLIIKPSYNDNSIGIDNDSVVYNERDLRRRVYFVNNTYDQPALVEEFMPGREFSVGVMGNKNTSSLPVSEYLFVDLPPEVQPILSYEAKWSANSQLYNGTVEVCPAQIPKYLEQQMKKMAADVFKILEVRDYGRVDIRLGRDGMPTVLEMNPNPGISADNTIPKAAISLGLSYNEMINEILIAALNRHSVKHNLTSKIFSKPHDLVQEEDKVSVV